MRIFLTVVNVLNPERRTIYLASRFKANLLTANISTMQPSYYVSDSRTAYSKVTEVSQQNHQEGTWAPITHFLFFLITGMHFLLAHKHTQHCPLYNSVKIARVNVRNGRKWKGQDRYTGFPFPFSKTLPAYCETQQDSHMTHPEHRQRSWMPGILYLLKSNIIELHPKVNMSRHLCFKQ